MSRENAIRPQDELLKHIFSPAYNKYEMSVRNIFKDTFFWVTAIIGLILMLLTLHFDINPVEGSVVPEYIQGTTVHIILFIATMPAWITGLMLSSVLPLPFPVMACTMQILLYGILGKIIRRGSNLLRKR